MKYSIDTRTLEPGDIFIPVKGPNFDGHDFIPEAIKKGASKIIDEDLGQFAKKYRKKLTAQVIGITGSYGKTTLKDMLHAALSPYFNVVKSHQNQNNEIGVPLTLLNATAETDIIIVEMGMRKKGDIAYLSKIARPSIGIITGIGYSHQAFFKSQKDIAKGKAALFQKPLSWETEDRLAYICQHSDYLDLLKKYAQNKHFKVFTYAGQTQMNDPISCCYMIGQHFGLSHSDIEQGLSQYHPSEHRLSVTRHGGIRLVDDTYNANPHAMRYALEFIKQYSGRKIAVLGDMKELGEDTHSMHQGLEEALIDAEIAVLITLGDGFKTCQFTSIDHQHCETKAAAYKLLLSEIKTQDTILFKGSRCHELETLVQQLQESL